MVTISQKHQDREMKGVAHQTQCTNPPFFGSLVHRSDQCFHSTLCLINTEICSKNKGTELFWVQLIIQIEQHESQQFSQIKVCLSSLISSKMKLVLSVLLRLLLPLSVIYILMLLLLLLILLLRVKRPASCLGKHQQTLL